MLLQDASLSELDDHELFFLALACHFHDLAMAGTLLLMMQPQKGENRSEGTTH